MPVQKQLVPVPMQGGIDTKKSKLAVMAGNLLELENGVFNSAGEIGKRTGYERLSNSVEGGGDVLAGVALSAFQDELLLFDGSNVYTRVEATGTWLDRGTAISVIPRNDQVIRTSNEQQLNADVALLNGIEVWAWEASTGGVRYAAVDAVTRAYCVSNALVHVDGRKPKVLAFGSVVVILYTDGANNLSCKVVNTHNPTVLSAQVHLIADGMGDFHYDACCSPTRLYVAYLSSASPDGAIKVVAYDSTFTSTNIAIVEDTDELAIADGFEGCLNIVRESAGALWVSWGTGEQVRTARYSATLVQLLASTQVQDSVEVVTLAGIESSAGSQTLKLVYEVTAADDMNHRLGIATITSAGSVAVGTPLRSVGLASKPFTYGGRLYVNTAHQSPLQSTYFTHLLDAAPYPAIAKVSPSLAGGHRTNHMLSEVLEVSTGVCLWANGNKGKLNTEAGAAFSYIGVNATRLDFASSNGFLSVTASRNLLTVGGVIQSYDGISFTEQNFHLAPEAIGAVASGSDGFLSTGTYQYVVIWQWTDNRGQDQRSTPSVPKSVSVTSTNHVTLTIPTLRITAKQGARHNVSVVIYRTLANGTEFHRITSALVPTLNDPTVDSIDYVDILSDSSIAGNELRYTTGSILPNAAPPAASLICTYKNRVFLAGLEDANLLAYSKNRFDNSSFNTIPVEFAAELTVGVDPDGGAITAIASYQDKLVIFKRSAIYTMWGDGPNDTGLGEAFPDPVRLVGDVGCVTPNSVVETPLGLMFRAEKGIYLFNGESAQYIGAQVERWNDYPVTSATVIPEENVVIFTTHNGPALVYNYFFGQWSTFTNHYAVDADVFGGRYVYTKANGKVYRSDPERFDDDGRAISLLWTSPNFAVAGLNGYQRAFRAYLLGFFKGKHRLKIEVAYDYAETYTHADTIDASSNVTTWGDDATWGASSVWGGEYSIYEFRVDFARQKCTAIRLRVSDLPDGDPTEGYAIGAVTLEIGVLPGGNRLKSSQIARPR